MNVRTVISVLGLVLISTNAFASKGVQNQERHSLTQPLKDAVGPKVAEYIPNISVVLDVGFGATFGSKQLITDGSMGPNGFSLLCADLEIEGHVDRFFRYAFLFDFAGLEIEEAYIATTALPIGMQIRAGYMFVPFGRQNPRHIHNWNFISQTLTQTRFMGEGKFAALGAELLFDLPLPWEMQISGQILDAHEATHFHSSSFATVEQTNAGKFDGMEDFVYTARILNGFDLGEDFELLWGLSGAWGQSPYKAGARSDLYGTELRLNWIPAPKKVAVGMTVEYLIRKMDVPEGTLLDHGGYIELDALVHPEWMLGFRAEYTDVISGVMPESEQLWGREWRAGVSTTFIPTSFSKLRLQYEIRHRGSLSHAVFLQLEVGAGEDISYEF
ncbi:MAG TPA: hypothetical protein P5317_03810 [Myxococcota bacterium]|nr:hypothetical protein [Myxococcota bacterium]HPC91340.1 hypothetical protein [Myxococcota bacterium]HRR73859.1 hypothetical protein [Myxococcota bacterium]HRV17126.1 hypothetical protein [Myxococcota bacterium]